MSHRYGLPARADTRSLPARRAGRESRSTHARQIGSDKCSGADPRPADERDRAAAGRTRVLFLYRAITIGQPAPDRVKGVTGRIGAAAKRQVVEVFGQKKLLKWSVPGAAHFFVFWAFVILATVYLEAYGSLVKLLFTGGEGPMDWAIPIVGHWALLGFLQDFIAVMALFGLVTFVCIRLQNAPKTHGRRSRFFGSHLERRLDHALHDLQRHLDDVPVPRRLLGPGQPALRERRVRLDRRGRPARRAQPRRPGGPRGHRPAAAHRRDAGLPDLRAQLQAPAHLPGAAQRPLRARAEWRWARPSR